MVNALIVLLGFQLIGEVISRMAALPVPGPVVGMGLLFIALIVRGGPGEELDKTASGLLGHLSLLFVPAGTGIMLHAERLESEWLPLAAALLVSTMLCMGIAAICLHLFLKRRGHRE